MASVSLRKLTKRWGDFIAVDTFDLEIQDQEFLVLLGPSGCGKTTTMRMIAGLEDITEGDIFFDDHKVNNLEPKDRDIAMVFQSYGLYPNMNVYENVRFPLKVRSIDPATHDERVMRAAEMVELTDFLHRRPAELSGGQRQRVALARAIVREPNVFLMDEPLSNLDAKLRVSTRAQIKHLHHELKVTTIYVTHDQIEAMTLADRVVVMDKGVVQQVGTPTDIYDRPANVFVAGFIGENNTFTGTVKELASGSAKVETSTGEIIIANPIAVSSAGEKSRISLRPERVNINPTEQIENRFEAEIKEIIYHGDHTRVRVNLLGNDDFILKVPNASSNSKLNLGDKLNLGWSSQDCRALDY